MLRVSFTLETLGIADDLAPLHKKATQTALKKTASYWQKEFLPLHFTPDAARRYNYKPRDAPYQRRKLRQKGHNRPLVWSGETERAAMRKGRRQKAGDKAVNLILRVPFYIANNFAVGNQLEFEMTKTTPAERVALSAFFAKAYDKERKKLAKKEKKTETSSPTYRDLVRFSPAKRSR